MRLAEEKKIVPLLASANTGAGVSLDSINMKNYHRACVIFTNGATSGSAVLKVYSGATAAAATSEVDFSYAYGGGAIAAASADVLSATTNVTAASGLTLASATFSSKMMVFEVEASNMDVANKEEWLTFVISSAGTSGITHAVAILEPRYTDNISGTSLA
jgi:hypothetical protein